ncbi:MAG: nucleotide exchange factor GrpE [Bdellovibrionales bacterium]|nr:nucleotide exchange factor GrpE [Bdellovibrionales bacterium]
MSTDTPNGSPNEAHAASSPQGASETGAVDPLTELRQQLEEKDSRYKYLYADFENYKRRVMKERSDLLKFACEPVARDLLQVSDNLERALAHAPENTDPALIEGVQMTLKQFHGVMSRHGIAPIKTEGADFDPNLHEALVHAPSKEVAAGKILTEETRGYTLHGRLLRPSRVVVSAG